MFSRSRYCERKSHHNFAWDVPLPRSKRKQCCTFYDFVHTGLSQILQTVVSLLSSDQAAHYQRIFDKHRIYNLLLFLRVILV